jgi:cytochrome b561
MSRRTTLKWLHWLSFGLIVYFFFVEPEDVDRLGAAALATHAGVGTVLAIIATIWFAIYLQKGLASRPGPKLPGWAKSLHGVNHRLMSWGLPLVVLSGALAGFAAPYAIRLFGLIPVFPGIGSKTLHRLFEDIHEIAFNVLLVVLLIHMGLHIWRHIALKDNALKVMAPKVLHRYL